MAAAAFVLVARYAPETKAPHPRRADLRGQLFLIVTLAALTYAVIEGPARGWGSVMTIILFAVAAVSLAIFLLVERRRAEPLLELRFSADPRLRGQDLPPLATPDGT